MLAWGFSQASWPFLDMYSQVEDEVVVGLFLYAVVKANWKREEQRYSVAPAVMFTSGRKIIEVEKNKQLKILKCDKATRYNH